MTIKNAKIIFKDFSAKGKYSGGRPSFYVALDEGFAKELIELGFNIKHNDILNTHYLKITISDAVTGYRPQLSIKNMNTNSYISWECASILDECDIKDAEVTINAAYWHDLNGKKHIKAYLDKLEGNICYDTNRKEKRDEGTGCNEKG